MASFSPESGSRTLAREEKQPLVYNNDSSYGGLDGAGLSGDESDISDSSHGVHCHVRSPQLPAIDKKARRQLMIASVLCLIFMLAEIVGGVIANSLAIVTDAAHLLTDFASFMISLLSFYIASRPATKSMSFGWYRAEVMGALVSVLMIWVVTGILVYMAIERVISGDYEINATVMLITAGVGVCFNVVMAFTLQHGHSHGGMSHAHSHSAGHSNDQPSGHSSGRCRNKDSENDGVDNEAAQEYAAISNRNDDASPIANGHEKTENAETKSRKVAGNVTSRTLQFRKTSEDYPSTDSLHIDISSVENHDLKKSQEPNINVRAAFIHVIGDLIQSVGILIAAFIIYFKPEWKVADPISTFIFSVLVLITTITILRDALHVLMEGAPRGISFSEVKASLCSIDGVKELHNLRLWSLTMNKTAVSVHLALERNVEPQPILSQASETMWRQFGVHECTVQIEEYVNEMENCDQCQGPQN